MRSLEIATDQQTGPHPGIQPQLRELQPAGKHGVVESWLQRHLNALAALVIAAGFVIRLIVASRSFLNPDEALLYLFSNQKTAYLACKASLGTAHPPLLLIFLYFWNFLGHSELMLRLPSVFAGTGFCWFIFKWMEKAFSRTAGWIALSVAAFSPTLIGISAELRQYSLLLFFTVAALYYLEAAIQESSARKMWCFNLFLFAAILVHYAAVFFVLAAGLYTLARLADAKLPGKTIVVWGAGQAGALAIYGILYVTQVTKVKEMIPLWSGYYNQYYFHGEFEDIFTFLRENTPPVFHYLFGEKYIGEIMLVLWAVGVAILLLRGVLPGRGYSHSSQLGLLVLLPFMAVWAAAIAGKYPYFAGRHTVLLAPFAIAVVSALLASVAAQRLWRGLLVGTVLAAVLSAFGYSAGSFPITEDQRRGLMSAAVRYVQETIPRNEPILLDYQSSMMAAYYLCAPEEARGFYASATELTPVSCNGHLFAALNFRSWMLTDKNFPSKFGELVRQFGMKRGNRVWVIQMGWGANLDAELRENVPQLRCLTAKRFGKEIVIIPLAVSRELSAEPVADCEGGAYSYQQLLPRDDENQLTEDLAKQILNSGRIRAGGVGGFRARAAFL